MFRSTGLQKEIGQFISNQDIGNQDINNKTLY